MTERLNIPESFRRFRKKFGITQAQLSAVLGIAPTSYKYEQRGTAPTATTLFKIALAFGVSTDYLLGLTDDPTPRWSVDAAPVKKSPADEAAAEMTTAPEMTPAEIAGRIERIERALKDAGITL